MVATLHAGGVFGTAGSIDGILKEFYLGPLQKQLNNEILALQLFEKMSVDWNGRQVIIPLHIGRNNGVGYRQEGAALPGAGQQGYADLHLQARFMYGRFQVSGPAMAAAKKGGKHSFIAALEGEMTGLKDDIRNRANQACFSGGRFKGYIHQRTNLAVAPGVTTGAAVAPATPNQGINVFEYSGSYDAFNGTTGLVVPVLATPATWIRIQMFNASTMARIDTAAVQGAADFQVYVAAIDEVGQTITLAHCTTAGAPASLNTLAPTAVGECIAIAIHPNNTQNLITGLAQLPGLVTQVTAAMEEVTSQPEGIYGNLSAPVWHGDATLDRTLVANAAVRCSVVRPCNIAVAAQGRIVLTFQRIQAVFDEVLLVCDDEPDLMLINPVARQRYIALAQLVINSDASTVTGADGGFKSNQLSYGGVKFKVSRHCARSMILGLKTKHWKMVQLQSGEFADLDGAVLSRVANQDNWEGFYRWYYNMVCLRPNANFILVGFTI